MVLLIHERHDKPLLKNGVFAGTGTYTNIAVSKTVHKRLGKPFNECRLDLAVKPSDSIYYKIAASVAAYSHDICQAIYSQIMFYESSCGCHNPELEYSNKTMICGTSGQVKCMIRVAKYLTSDSMRVKYYSFIPLCSHLD